MNKPAAEPSLMREVAMSVVRRLQEAGHEGWFVGGCVREMVLDLEPADYDVTTDAEPDRVEQLFDHVVEVGRRFGVMTVIERGVHRCPFSTPSTIVHKSKVGLKTLMLCSTTPVSAIT